MAAQYFRLIAAACVMGVVTLMGATPAWAQQRANAEGPGPITEIVVTTRKVEESLQDVPLAINAFDSAAIEAAGISDLSELAALTPGLSFFSTIGEFQPTPIIRGISQVNISGETNVAIFVDGVYVSARQGLNFSQLDLERVEVVKGPQSALYGRNAFSGLINYVTKTPGEAFDARAELTTGIDGKQLAQGAIGGPIAPGLLAGRIAVSYDSFDGSYDNTYSGVDIGGYRYLTGQGSLSFTPTESLDITLHGYWSRDRIDEAATTALQANCEDVIGSGPNDRRLANFCGRVPKLPSNDLPKISQATGERRDVVRASLTANLDLGVGTLTWLSGFSDTEQRAVTDGTRNLAERMPFVYCRNGLAGLPFCSGSNVSRFFTGLVQVTPPETTREISQEIRFASSQDSRFRYLVGGYFYDVDNEEAETGLIATRPLPSDIALVALDDDGVNNDPGLGPFVPVNALLIPIGSGAYSPWFTPNGDVNPATSIDNENRSYAVFLSGELDVTRRLTAGVQVRYGRDQKDISLPLALITLPPELQGLGIQLDSAADDSWSQVTGRADLKFRVNDDWMFYGSVATGEKPGGFGADNVDLVVDRPNQTPVTIEDVPVIVSFEPEEIRAFELGAKGRTAGGNASIDLSVFLYDWSEIVVPQVFSRDPNSGLPFEQPEGFETNAGDARVWGWEADVNVRFSDYLTGRFGAAWTDAIFTDAKLETFADFPTFEPTGDVTGNEVPRQSRWQANASLTYRQPVFGSFDFYGRTDVSYKGKYFVGADNQGTIPAHTFTNFRLGLESSRFTFEAFCDNCLNEDEPTSAFRIVYFNNTDDIAGVESPPVSTPFDFFPWQLTVSHPRLRTYGLSAKVRFGAAER